MQKVLKLTVYYVVGRELESRILLPMRIFRNLRIWCHVLLIGQLAELISEEALPRSFCLRHLLPISGLPSRGGSDGELIIVVTADTSF